MKKKVTDIKHIDRPAYVASGLSPKQRKFVRHAYERVQKMLDEERHLPAERGDYDADRIEFDWGRNEIAATVCVRVRCKFWFEKIRVELYDTEIDFG